MQEAVVIIPARMGSTRFPGKVLADLGGKPLIRHVWERSRRATRVSDVIIATDSDEVYRVVTAFGGHAVMTSEAHASGTDRIAEAAATLNCDIIVNVQGDEPLIRPELIDQCIELFQDERAEITTAAAAITSQREAQDPNAVKVVFSDDGFALYFSRAPIPWHRDDWGSLHGVSADKETTRLFKHIGLYGYRRDALLKFAALPQSALERIERLEQLRALENHMKIKVFETTYQTLGVDTPEDLERVRQCLNTSS